MDMTQTLSVMQAMMMFALLSMRSMMQGIVRINRLEPGGGIP